MPIYQVATQHGMLNDELKAKVASAITDAHVEATGAPRVFVHVFLWSEITGQPQKQVVAGLTEIDSDITMEYGLILPHPGGEPEWFARNAVALDGISGTGL